MWCSQSHPNVEWLHGYYLVTTIPTLQTGDATTSRKQIDNALKESIKTLTQIQMLFIQTTVLETVGFSLIEVPSFRKVIQQAME